MAEFHIRYQVSITFSNSKAKEVKEAYDTLKKAHYSHADVYLAGLKKLEGANNKKKVL